MPGMAVTPPRTQPRDEHDAEAAKQLEIATEVEAATAKSAAPPVPDETVVVEEAPKVTLRSVNVDEYPLTVTVPNAEPLVFENDRATIEVDSEVAEQIAYSPVVEVVE